MKVLCRTLFDCTFTGVTGHLRPQQLPFTTKTGLVIHTPEQWNRSRNQQRNWESLLQIMSLRTQPMNVIPPTKHTDGWHFEFDVESEGVLGSNFGSDDLDGLVGDCEGVPMMLNLTEQPSLEPTITTNGKGQNIWFIAVNNALE
jgi:hypothetical protein